VGLAYVVLCACLGTAVWEGFPNAASRVLLPLTLAFNVRLVRDRAKVLWFVLGNLSVAAGFHAVQFPVGQPHELPARGGEGNRQVLETDARWAVAEWNARWRWAWCYGEGDVTYRLWPKRATVTLELQVRGITPRPLEVWHAGQRVWQGPIGDHPQWISLPALPTEQGHLTLTLRSPGAAAAEGADNTARTISFACFGARLKE
jgi:hypothetical protein